MPKYLSLIFYVVVMASSFILGSPGYVPAYHTTQDIINAYLYIDTINGYETVILGYRVIIE